MFHESCKFTHKKNGLSQGPGQLLLRLRIHAGIFHLKQVLLQVSYFLRKFGLENDQLLLQLRLRSCCRNLFGLGAEVFTISKERALGNLPLEGFGEFAKNSGYTRG